MVSLSARTRLVLLTEWVFPGGNIFWLSSTQNETRPRARTLLGEARTSAGSRDNERTCFRRTLLTHTKTLMQIHLCPMQHTLALQVWPLSWTSDPHAGSSCPSGYAMPWRVTETEPGVATGSVLKHLLSYIPLCSVLSGYNYRIRPLGIRLYTWGNFHLHISKEFLNLGYLSCNKHLLFTSQIYICWSVMTNIPAFNHLYTKKTQLVLLL